jgi:hemerythrin
MKWSEQFATGIPRIDNHHRRLFKLAEDFRAALDEGAGARTYGTLLQALAIHTRAHFGFEERCMRVYRCPVARENTAAHGRFREVLSEFQQRYVAHGFDRAAARALMDFLDQWFTGHVGRIDVQLKHYVGKP